MNNIDVVANIAMAAAADPTLIHLKTFNLPPQEKKLVISTAGIVELGNSSPRATLGINKRLQFYFFRRKWKQEQLKN